MKELLKLAVALHGHLAPGLALGIRMGTIGLKKLDTKKGSKKLIGISETGRCLGDGMQVSTGCTLGHGSAMVKHYGKLALTLGRVDSMRGVRIALKNDAYKISPVLKKWMMRGGKLSRDEEKELGGILLNLDEKHLDIKDVELMLGQNFENSPIVKCKKCEDLIPMALSVEKDGDIICEMCAGEGYYRAL
ncbi:MAG: FmdE family protein [Candidatus Hydrothermarchaeaceae archaeon]